MKKLFLRAIAVSAAIAIAACSSRTGFIPNGSSSFNSPVFGSPTASLAGVDMNLDALQAQAAPRYRACPVARPGEFQCYMWYSNYEINSAVDHSSCLGKPGCYGPTELRNAYNISSQAASGGKGMTVAVVDAYAYPTAARDLAGYRKFFKLPAANLTIVGQTGGKPPRHADPNWDQEQALDLDMVSAICPNCKIVLVEVSNTQFGSFGAGETTALKMANVVSNSWGGPEFAKSGSMFDSHSGKVVTASSGDQGAGSNFYAQKASAQQPCSFQGVVCVGGSSLVVSHETYKGEVVWDGLTRHQCGSSGASPCATGSGCSSMIAKPSWQKDKGCAKRSETDISADGDPYTGVVIAIKGKLFGGAGGTSASSPMIAAMYALAGNASSATAANIWSAGGGSSLHAITSGTNENKAAHTYICSSKILYICKAGTKMNGVYSGPTGWGSPNGLGAL